MAAETVTHIIIGTFGFILTGLVVLVCWLLSKLIHDIDMKFDQQNQHLANQDGKLDALAASRSAHGESIVELRVRVACLEAREVVMAQHIDDHGRFLQGDGYRKRKMPGEEGP